MRNQINNKKEKKKLFILVYLLLTLGLGLGYAILSEQLSIDSTVNYGAMAWDVGFTSATDGGGSVSSTTAISTDKKTVTIDCDLGTSTASETCIAKTRIKNASSFAVVLSKDPTITFNNTYINSVEVTWTDNSANVVAGNSIGINVEKEIQITITTKELTEDMLPENSLSIPIKITMDWVEGDDITTVTREKQLIENIVTTDDIATLSTGVQGSAPYSYHGLDIFAGHKLTKIGIPVKSVTALDENQTFTLYVIDNTTLKQSKKATVKNTYQLKLPLSQLGNDAANVNKFVYVDLTEYDITLNENETLAFYGKTDSIKIGYIGADLTQFHLSTDYQLVTKVLDGASFLNDVYLAFDIYVEEVVSVQPTLESVLSGKNLSILGDSISTYQGYSNDANVNSTLKDNVVYYTDSKDTTKTITSVNNVWWMQVAQRTGLNVLVNNSSSGDTVANAKETRAKQLHNNSGTNPDIIAVYMGINDIKNGSSVDEFRTNYNTLISSIKETYPNADIFVLTHIPYECPTATVPEMNSSQIEPYNEVIREIASANGLTVVDYAQSGITDDNFMSYIWDYGLHPNAAGMDKISGIFINKLEEVYLNMN